MWGYGAEDAARVLVDAVGDGLFGVGDRHVSVGEAIFVDV